MCIKLGPYILHVINIIPVVITKKLINNWMNVIKTLFVLGWWPVNIYTLDGGVCRHGGSLGECLQYIYIN